MDVKDGLVAALVIFLWGINFYFTKLALLEISPMMLGLLRFVFLLFPALFFIKRPDVKWYWLAAYGLTISFAQFGLLFSAIYVGMPTGLAALLHQAQAFFTVLIAALLWREPVKPNQFAAMLLAAAGLVLIGVGQYRGQLPAAGMVLSLAAALAWAFGNIIVKQIGRVNALSLVVWGNVFTLFLFAAASLVLYGADGMAAQFAALTWRGWAGVLFLAYAAGLVGYACWGRLLSRHPAGLITPLALFVPVLALVVAWAVLHEPLNGWHWGGAAVVMAALLVQVFGGRLFKYSGLK
ncbi:MAG: EamA family transporter [Neisseria sp.]|nr:EamA family transporter [Neisseria sp.]